MSLPSKRYVLFGFSRELDWRPLQFVEPVPGHRICIACGLLPRTTVCLPCRHVLCKTCYEQSSVNDGYECPFDGERSREEDAAYVDFSLGELLSRKVKCWNMNNGCDAVMNALEILRHFDRDCIHHTAQCPECSTFVLHRDACKHRRNRCGWNMAPSRVQDLEPSEESVHEATSTELEAMLVKRVEDIRCGFDQVVRDHTTVCDRLNDISHAVNKINETVMQTSEGQTRATTDAITASVGEVKEHQAEHGEVLQEVSQRMQALIEYVETVAATEAKQCLEKLEQAHLELMRSCARDDSRFESISKGISTFVGLLDKSQGRTTKTISEEPRTMNDLNAASKSRATASRPSVVRPRNHGHLLGFIHVQDAAGVRRMTETEIETLCSVFWQLSLEDMRGIADAYVDPFRRVRDATTRYEGMREIRSALVSVDSHHERIHHMATVYCWMLPRNDRLPWALFQLTDNSPPIGDFTVHMLLASAMSLPGVDIAYMPMSSENARYACAITSDTQSEPEEHVIFCMYAWDGIPCLAIYTPEENHLERIESLLESVLDLDIDDTFVGMFTGIDSTLSRAIPYLDEDDTE
ncbi:hypothetical protein HPB50_012809 [Hyalomma asiaticum]|uniref:Uncharacterized protein n=1 Tax=Hyalomma asiaticum TaxID=266040 RepID=A0ACB7RNS1_HYAAI|nr:hypothetical protein HPB50_012809 [Hyalomma asiaticum]